MLERNDLRVVVAEVYCPQDQAEDMAKALRAWLEDWQTLIKPIVPYDTKLVFHMKPTQEMWDWYQFMANHPTFTKRDEQRHIDAQVNEG